MTIWLLKITLSIFFLFSVPRAGYATDNGGQGDFSLPPLEPLKGLEPLPDMPMSPISSTTSQADVLLYKEAKKSKVVDNNGTQIACLDLEYISTWESEDRCKDEISRSESIDAEQFQVNTNGELGLREAPPVDLSESAKAAFIATKLDYTPGATALLFNLESELFGEFPEEQIVTSFFAAIEDSSTPRKAWEYQCMTEADATAYLIDVQGFGTALCN